MSQTPTRVQRVVSFEEAYHCPLNDVTESHVCNMSFHIILNPSSDLANKLSRIQKVVSFEEAYHCPLYGVTESHVCNMSFHIILVLLT